MGILEKKYNGRGVKLLFGVTPKLKEEEFGLLRKVLVADPLLENILVTLT